MSKVPTTTNPAASQAEAYLKQFETLLLPIIEKAIVNAYPALGLPLVKQIMETAVKAGADQITKLESQGVTFLIIDTQVNAETHQISKELAALLAAEKLGNPDAIKTAIQNYANTHSALVHDDGSAPSIR